MPLELRTKQQLADAARILAQSFELVQRGATTFIPVDWQTYSPDPPPPVGQKIWIPFIDDDIKRLANIKPEILFASDGEFRSFVFMIRQFAEPDHSDTNTILIRTKSGLKVLNEEGELVEHDGQFIPNFVRPTLNENEEDKARVFKVIAEWLRSEDEAHSLLRHLATTLAPGYSAVKYVILLGEGRNGKGVLLEMLARLFGVDNYSQVTRQAMAESSSTCIALNDKLVNIVFDGQMAYIKDSSMEKTLVAGEPGTVRKLYESGSTTVQTNALFIEALNHEPKTRDKSTALQKRLVRFEFPNVYKQDRKFSKEMWSDKSLGAFLSLLIDHFVQEDELAEKLSLTEASLGLQAEQVWLGSPVLQFVDSMGTTDPSFVERLIDGKVSQEYFLNGFKPWLSTQGRSDYTDADLASLLKGTFEIGWKTIRQNGKPTSVKTIRSVRPDALAVIESMKGVVDHANIDTEEELVGDEFLS